MEYYSTIKKNKTMAFEGKWMELENIMLSETSQSPKNERPNVFPDKWMMIYNGEGCENNGGTFDYTEEMRGGEV